MLELDFAERSDPGKARGHNEDFLGHARPDTPSRARSHGWLFALADGVGGMDRGEVASRAAVERALESFRASRSGENLTTLATGLVRAANLSVYEAGNGGIATTLVVCALRHDRAAVAHVGDSRCYLVRRGEAQQLTRDHTVAQEQARLGLLSEKEMADTPNRGILSRSLGTGLFVNVDVAERQLDPGDALVLCCDGVHHSVAPADIAAAAGLDGSPESIAQSLVDLANERDGSDNVSVQVIRIRGVERVGMYRGRPYNLR